MPTWQSENGSFSFYVKMAASCRREEQKCGCLWRGGLTSAGVLTSES